MVNALQNCKRQTIWYTVVAWCTQMCLCMAHILLCLFVWSAVHFFILYLCFAARVIRNSTVFLPILRNITKFFPIHTHFPYATICHASICERARKNKCSSIVCGTSPAWRSFFFYWYILNAVMMIHTGVNEWVCIKTATTITVNSQVIRKKASKKICNCSRCGS